MKRKPDTLVFMEKRVKLIVFGRVQLVMYRDFARRKAKRFGITGWVKNLKDNTVEILAEGEEQDLKDYIDMLEEGPWLAEVAHIEVRWWNGVTKEFKHFEILYD